MFCSSHRILWAGVLFLVVLARGILTAQAPAKTVWDGAYTDAQAERAQGTFSATCSRCHTLTPDGARPLVGDQFWQANTQKTVGDLLKFVSTNMPNGRDAGSLSPSSYNDLVALILKSNGFPAGTTEVTPEAVASIQIIPKDGPGELPANTLVRVVGCLAPKEWRRLDDHQRHRAAARRQGGRGHRRPDARPGRPHHGVEVRAVAPRRPCRQARVGQRNSAGRRRRRGHQRLRP